MTACCTGQYIQAATAFDGVKAVKVQSTESCRSDDVNPVDSDDTRNPQRRTRDRNTFCSEEENEGGRLVREEKACACI